MKDIVERLRMVTSSYLHAGEQTALRDEAADTITTLRAEVERLKQERKARHPRQFKYAPTPWSYEGNSNDGYYILDANKQKIAMLLWPIHPVEETEAVEAEAPLVADFISFQSAWLTATTLDFFDMERCVNKLEAALEPFAKARASSGETLTLEHFNNAVAALRQEA